MFLVHRKGETSSGRGGERVALDKASKREEKCAAKKEEKKKRYILLLTLDKNFFRTKNFRVKTPDCSRVHGTPSLLSNMPASFGCRIYVEISRERSSEVTRKSRQIVCANN
eukprot:TRINITY_DN6282_c0_g2_i1.p1 TRINITY_DN6282_c0_g2~~TRINITY_DN6282_c0_g2_i1.p1  ORF type:complete len:111 (-),score=0.82 TRINITY_DN6282_c0_g2_i1:13-345(-)